MPLRDYLPPILEESYPPKSNFAVEKIPDLKGKVCIVTGGSAGVGKETVKALLNHNAIVYIAARNKEKTSKIIEDLKTQTGKEAIFLHLELDNLKSIKESAASFQMKEKKLHILYNNAGVMAPPIDQLTADGYDLQFGTNVLGHFYFTQLLLPLLLSTAKSSKKGDVRVVNTSSSGHLFVRGINYDTLKDSPQRKKLGTQKLYAQSKFGNVLYSNEFARRYGSDIVSISLNPGNLRSELQRHLSWFEKLILKLMLYPTEYGALTQLWGGTSDEGASLNGQYLIPWARLGKARKETQDQAEGKKLWEWLEEQVKGLY